MGWNNGLQRCGVGSDAQALPSDETGRRRQGRPLSNREGKYSLVIRAVARVLSSLTLMALGQRKQWSLTVRSSDYKGHFDRSVQWRS